MAAVVRMEDGAVDVKEGHRRRKIEQARADQHENASLGHWRTSGQTVVAAIKNKIVIVVLFGLVIHSQRRGYL